MRKLVILILIIIFPSVTFADSEKITNINCTTTFCKNFKINGYLDGSYNYLYRSNKFTSGIYDRVYDIDPNGFTLHQASLTLAYQPKEGFGALFNPILGRDAFIWAPYGWNPDTGTQQLAFAFPQAFLQYANKSFTFIAGLFNTLVGAEYLDPTQDTNFSRSILWGYATPTTHLGVRGTYVPCDQLTLIAGLNNGWDNIRDTGRRKTIELSAVFTPTKIFSLAVTGYSGGQRAADLTSTGPQSIRNLLDIIATINASEKLTLVANYDYGIQPKAALPRGNIAEAVWQGIAGYINYKCNDKWRTSLRGEIFSDRNGYRTGVPQTWKEMTLTLGYTPLKNLELRAETRRDVSNVASFVKANGKGTSNNQQSFALEGVYTFG